MNVKFPNIKEINLLFYYLVESNIIIFAVGPKLLAVNSNIFRSVFEFFSN